MYMYAITPETQ